MNTIIDRPTRLRLRRSVKRRQKIVTEATQEAGTQFDSNVIRRLDRLHGVRRFVGGWLLLVLLMLGGTVVQTLALSNLYQVDQPVAGGTYNEGMVGTYSNANPIYATGAVDTAVSRLLFAGLLKYDEQNNLVGDLAQNYTVDETGKLYTVQLKPGLRWHDGQPLTAADVVFTYSLIQNADVRSPLAGGWRGISVASPRPDTITFTLPGILASFSHSLTTGIVPQHIVGKISPAQLRSHAFNTIQPVGSGPFAWDALQYNAEGIDSTAALISLKANPYYNGGPPKLQRFIIHTFEDDEQLKTAYKKRKINAMAGLKYVPADIAESNNTRLYDFQTTAVTMTFFKTTSGVLADTTVRKALAYGTRRNEIVKQLGQNLKLVRQPILMGQPGYDAAYRQPNYDPVEAARLLDQAGWVMTPGPGGDGIRTKAGQPLAFQLFAENTPYNKIVVSELAKSWRGIGVKVTPVLQQSVDFQTSLELHNYEAVLYGISIGPDPDVYAYWHSSQADNRAGGRLNFSEYKSAAADASLEAGRTRLEPEVRTLKYKPFMKAWYDDTPAVALFRPRIYYVMRGDVFGLTNHTLNTDADRYYSVADWSIRTAHVTKE